MLHGQSIIQEKKEVLNLQTGDLVAVVGSFPKEAHTNFLKIQEI